MRRIYLIGLASLLVALPLGGQQKPWGLSPKDKAKLNRLTRQYQEERERQWPRCLQEMDEWSKKLVGEMIKRDWPGLSKGRQYPPESYIQKDIPDFSATDLAILPQTCELLAYERRNDSVFSKAWFMDDELRGIAQESQLELAEKPLARLGEKEKPLPLRIVAEDIDGSESYQFAAADVIRTQFGNWFELDPKAELVLYISGTKGAGSYEAMTQGAEVRLEVFLSPALAAGGKTRRVTGTFVLAEEGGLVKNFTSDERVQFVKEKVYAALTEFIQNWEAAPQ